MLFRPQKDSALLEECSAEEVWQREYSQKIHRYRLARENVLEHQKQQQRIRKEKVKQQQDTYKKMQAAMFQEKLRFSEAMKGLAQGSATKEALKEVQTGGEEERPAPATSQEPEKHGNK